MSKMMFSQSIDESISMVEKLIQNFEAVESGDQERFVTVLISKPGLGKSATISKLAKRIGYELIDLSLSAIEPTDILGLGAREKVDGVWQTIPALPTWTQKALAGKCIIFVDEFNNCTADVLAGFQKMFSDFVIDGQPLPRTTHIVGACNPPGKDAIFAAKRLSGAFRRRLCMVPVVDDFRYVMEKHNFEMPYYLMNNVDYDDLMEYCDYEDLSSAVVDNIMTVAGYKNMTEREKVSLINGFGSGALTFAKQMNLFSADVFATGSQVVNKDVSYSDWKRTPDNRVPEYQQVLWGQQSITNSRSYSRSKAFVSRVVNDNVYMSLRDVMIEKFARDHALDPGRLPERSTRASTVGGTPPGAASPAP